MQKPDPRHMNHITIRITDEEQKQLEQHAEELRARNPGMYLSLSQVVRMNIMRGMDTWGDDSDD